MKICRLAFRLFYKNPFQHCLLILQMVLVFIIGSSVVSEINGFFYQRNIINNLNTNNYVFFQKVNERELLAGSSNVNDLMNYKEFDLDTVKEQLNGTPDIITETSIFASSQDRSIKYQISCFNQKLLNQLCIPIIKGHSSFTSNISKGLVRFITDSTDFEVGEKIPVLIDDNGSTIEVTLLVIGIAKTPFYGPTTSSTATIPDVSTILSEYTKSDQNFISGLICSEDLQRELNSVVSYDFNYHIFFEETLSKSEKEENMDILKQYGNVSTGIEIMKETNKDIYDSLKLQLPDIIFICLIAFVGFCGISLTNISSNMPIFAIYSILGCSNFKCYLMLFFYVFIINISALTPTVLLLLLASYSERIAMYFPFVNYGTFAIILIIALSFFLISFVFVLFSFKKHSTKQLLRGN